MDKQKYLRRYSSDEDKLLISKIIDKVNNFNTRNKMVYTDFLDPYQKQLVKKFLKEIKQENFLFLGGYSEAERECLLLYPDYISNIEKIKSEVVNIIEIKLPNEVKGKYNHKNYLSMIMKLGMRREKTGDIIITEDGAQIIVLKEVSGFLSSQLSNLTRMHKAQIDIKSIDTIKNVKLNFESQKIIFSSLRLDVIIAGILKISRTAANEIILSERAYINWELQKSSSKQVKENDIITIRGKGRYKISEILGTTKKERIILKVDKFI